MKKTYTAVYSEPRSLEKYSEGKIILYPDEEIVENYTPEDAPDGFEPVTGYKYTGEETDGGYIRECQDMSNYNDVANAIIRTHYTLSEELALQRHYQNSPETYADEWDAYSQFADSSVAKAKAWLGIE